MTAPRNRRCTTSAALALAAILAVFEASAAYTCSVTATAISTVYDPTVGTANDSTGSYTISCTRLATDANTFNYTLDADDGMHNAGAQNRVQFGGPANRYDYELYRNAGYTQVWGDTGGTDINGTLNFGASLFATVTAPFYLRVPGGQAVDPAGTYTDTVGVTLSRVIAGPDQVLATTTFGVSVITTNSCQISVPPGPVSFAYTSFQPGPAAASTNFGVRCTSALPYTMALDATNVTDNAVNLAYTLALSAAGGTGTGVTQTYSVNGTMAAGQAGTCAVGACTNAASTNRTRTLTITY